jgi:hypothetical protein
MGQLPNLLTAGPPYLFFRHNWFIFEKTFQGLKIGNVISLKRLLANKFENDFSTQNSVK